MTAAQTHSTADLAQAFDDLAAALGPDPNGSPGLVARPDPATGQYRIWAGVKCLIRRAGNEDWRPYRTTKELIFENYTPADNGGRWAFRRGEWELKVSPLHVHGRKPETYEPSPTPRGCFGISRGRGASRRRNMRILKRR